LDRRREQKRKKYGDGGDTADADNTIPDNAEPVDDVDATSTQASQLLIDHHEHPDIITTGRRKTRFSSERSHDAAAASCWRSQLLPPPPPPPPPSRALLAAKAPRREFIETSF